MNEVRKEVGGNKEGREDVHEGGKRGIGRSLSNERLSTMGNGKA